jgi:hypothetical protein
MLTTLHSLNEIRYNQWLSTIKINFQVIEFDTVCIWEAIDDEKKPYTLYQAYFEKTVLTPIRVVFNLNNLVHIFRGKHYFYCRPGTGETSAEMPTSEKWPMLAETDLSHVDAALLVKFLRYQAGEDLDYKLYFLIATNIFTLM